jgi:chromosome segregation ATPase
MLKMSKQQQTTKRLENATRTLNNFETKQKGLKRRFTATVEKITLVTERINKKRARTELIRNRTSTKQSTVNNNLKFIKKREEELSRKGKERDALEEKMNVLAAKIEKKKKVVSTLTRKMNRSI